MEFLYRRSYVGPLQAVILDWAGTTVDYGCCAPVVTFVEVFKGWQIAITLPQARAPMGMDKKSHIRTILQMEPVTQQWQEVYGRAWNEDDVEAMFREFEPMQAETVRDYAACIPGTLEAIEDFRDRGLKIGTTTGYSQQVMDVLLPVAEANGYTPDSNVCIDDVPAARPSPFMCYQNAMNLGCYPMAAMVKVGDTIPDIEEGLNAGMWVVAVTKSGNELGLTEQEVADLDEQELEIRLQRASRRLAQAGAHYVVDTIADVPMVLDEIEARVSQGDCP
jgi:phosphonoacetaldehyde hydrolase